MAFVINDGYNEPLIFNTEQELVDYTNRMGFQYNNGTVIIPQPDKGIFRLPVTQRQVEVPTYSTIDNTVYQGGQLPTLVVRGNRPSGGQLARNDVWGSGNPIWGSNRIRGVARLEQTNPEYAESMREAAAWGAAPLLAMNPAGLSTKEALFLAGTTLLGGVANLANQQNTLFSIPSSDDYYMANKKKNRGNRKKTPNPPVNSPQQPTPAATPAPTPVQPTPVPTPATPVAPQPVPGSTPVATPKTGVVQDPPGWSPTAQGATGQGTQGVAAQSATAQSATAQGQTAQPDPNQKRDNKPEEQNQGENTGNKPEGGNTPEDGNKKGFLRRLFELESRPFSGHKIKAGKYIKDALRIGYLYTPPAALAVDLAGNIASAAYEPDSATHEWTFPVTRFRFFPEMGLTKILADAYRTNPSQSTIPIDTTRVVQPSTVRTDSVRPDSAHIQVTPIVNSNDTISFDWLE